MKLDNSLKELLKVAAMSAIVGGVSMGILKRPNEARIVGIIADQKKKIAELSGMIETAEGVADAGVVLAENGDLIKKFEGCKEELFKCRNKEIGQFMKDFYVCGKLVDTALYMKDLRSAVSCNTSRRIHDLIALGLERCDDAMAGAISDEERKLIEKENRKYRAIRADKKINPDGCVRAR